ncbi:MAG: DUF1028 domain-containing protein [Candidatus Heimdallarchaeota archaeon]|nr:DUF1028 domain-containing protein [Candidatus Heimdallarchaeota archaeon]
MTFSIVAFDKYKNEIGFAIASCCWSAGMVCEVTAKGAIAHQAKGNPKYHKIFFDKLDEKLVLEEILDHFKTIDEHIETRQIGMVSFHEMNTLSFTGTKCSHWAGHKTGANYACQGNTLVGSKVVENMSHAFENTRGSLTEKLYAVLLAGDNAGGDARGKQSARLCIKKIKDISTNDAVTVVDFDIKDHDEPVKEIGRLLSLSSNYQEIFEMSKDFDQSQTDEERSAILTKCHHFLEDKKESRYSDFWEILGFAYYSTGNTEMAICCLRTMLEISPKLFESFKIGAKSSGLPESLIKSILEK